VSRHHAAPLDVGNAVAVKNDAANGQALPRDARARGIVALVLRARTRGRVGDESSRVCDATAAARGARLLRLYVEGEGEQDDEEKFESHISLRDKLWLCCQCYRKERAKKHCLRLRRDELMNYSGKLLPCGQKDE
jgi:hypothetical protein